MHVTSVTRQLNVDAISISGNLTKGRNIDTRVQTGVLTTTRRVNCRPPTQAGTRRNNRDVKVLITSHFFGRGTFCSGLCQSMLQYTTRRSVSILVRVILPRSRGDYGVPSFLMGQGISNLVFVNRVDHHCLTATIRAKIPFVLLSFCSSTVTTSYILDSGADNDCVVARRLVSAKQQGVNFMNDILSADSVVSQCLNCIGTVLHTKLPVQSS